MLENQELLLTLNQIKHILQEKAVVDTLISLYTAGLLSNKDIINELRKLPSMKHCTDLIEQNLKKMEDMQHISSSLLVGTLKASKSTTSLSETL